MTGLAHDRSDVRDDNQTTTTSSTQPMYFIPQPIRRYTTTNPNTLSPTYHLLYDLTLDTSTPDTSIHFDRHKLQSNPLSIQAKPPYSSSPPLGMNRCTGSNEESVRGSVDGPPQYYLDTESRVDERSSGGLIVSGRQTHLGTESSNRSDVTNYLKGSRSRDSYESHVTVVKCQQTDVNKRRNENNKRPVSSSIRHHTANISAESQPHKAGLVLSLHNKSRTSEWVKTSEDFNQTGGVGFPPTESVAGKLVGTEISHYNNGVGDNTEHHTREITGNGTQLSSLTDLSVLNVVPCCSSSQSSGLIGDISKEFYRVNTTEYNSKKTLHFINSEHSLNTLPFELTNVNRRAIFKRNGDSVRLVLLQHDEDVNNDSDVVSDNETLTGVDSSPMILGKEESKSIASGLSLLPNFLRSSLKGKSKKKSKAKITQSEIHENDITGQRSRKNQLNRWHNLQFHSSLPGHTINRQGEEETRNKQLGFPLPVDLCVINTSSALSQHSTAHEKKETLDNTSPQGIKGILVKKENISHHPHKINIVQFKDQQNTHLSRDYSQCDSVTPKQQEIIDRRKYIIKPREIVRNTQISEGSFPSLSSTDLDNHLLFSDQSFNTLKPRDVSFVDQNNWLREHSINTSLCKDHRSPDSSTPALSSWANIPTYPVHKSNSNIGPHSPSHNLSNCQDIGVTNSSFTINNPTNINLYHNSSDEFVSASHHQVSHDTLATGECFRVRDTPQSEREESETNPQHTFERHRNLDTSVQKKILAHCKTALSDHKESPRAKFERNRAARTQAISSNSADRTASNSADRTAPNSVEKTTSDSVDRTTSSNSKLSSLYSNKKHLHDSLSTSPPPLPPRVKCVTQPPTKVTDKNFKCNLVSVTAVSSCQSLQESTNTLLVPEDLQESVKRSLARKDSIHATSCDTRLVSQGEQLNRQVISACFELSGQSANSEIQKNPPLISHCNKELNSPVTSSCKNDLSSLIRSNILNIADIVSQNEYIRQVLNQSTVQQLRFLFGQEYDDLSSLTSQSSSAVDNLEGVHISAVNEVFQDKTSESFSNTQHISNERFQQSLLADPSIHSSKFNHSIPRLNSPNIFGKEQCVFSDKKTLKQAVSVSLDNSTCDTKTLKQAVSVSLDNSTCHIASSHRNSIFKTNNSSDFSGKDQHILGNVQTHILRNPSQTDMLASKGLRIYDSVDDYVALVRSPIHKSMSAPQFTWEGNTYLIVPTVLEDETEKTSRGKVDAAKLSEINLIDFVTPKHDSATLVQCQNDSGSDVAVSDDTDTYITMTSSVDRNLNVGHRAMSVEVLCAGGNESFHNPCRVPGTNQLEAGYVEWRTCSGWVGQTDLRPTVDEQNSRGYVEWDTIWSPTSVVNKCDDHVYDVIGDDPSPKIVATTMNEVLSEMPPALPERTYIQKLKQRSNMHHDASHAHCDSVSGPTARPGHSNCHCSSYGRKHHHHHHHRHNHNKVHTRPPPPPPTHRAVSPSTQQVHVNLTTQTDKSDLVGYNYAEVNKLRGYMFSNSMYPSEPPPKPHRPEHSAISSENYCRLEPETSADNITSWQSGDLLDFIDGLHDSMSSKRRENIYILLNNKKTRAKFSESLEIESRLLSRGLICTSTLTSQTPTVSSDEWTSVPKHGFIRRKGATAPVSSTYV